MSNSINIKIDDIEYQLKGDDVELTLQAALELDDQIKQLKGKYKSDLPQITLTVLAALNLAEAKLAREKELLAERESMLSEINRMSDYLAENLK